MTRNKWAVLVIADDSGEWVGNAVRYATKEEAEQAATDLAWRWLSVRDWKVVETRRALVTSPKHGDPIELLNRVQDYLPRNYVAQLAAGEIAINGWDNHGWTLDGYVLPRLASGLIIAEEA